MRDRDLYARILGVEKPWSVVDVVFNREAGKVEIFLEYGGPSLRCPKCDRKSGGYDTRERRWRHLDTCQFRTILIAQVPRVECQDHGVHQVTVAWAQAGSRLTALFEALVIDWLKEASISAVARMVNLSWDQVDGVMQRAVARGLARRERRLPPNIGVDEKSFKKGHKYVTIVHDAESGHVIHVADERKRSVLTDFYDQFSVEELSKVESVTMDMWGPYIEATRSALPDADKKIGFDKYHVASHLGGAVNKVRRGEHKQLLRTGDDRLSKTRYLWLRNPENFDKKRWVEFAPLRTSTLKTARAWALKEIAMQLWHYTSRAWAKKGWLRWYGWAIRSRLKPMKEVARMVKRHLEGIITAVVKKITNARAEGLNSVVQWLKYTARGFRNRDRFKWAIYFHLGGLDLYPAGIVR